MSERDRTLGTWAAVLLSALALAGGVAMFAARSAAATEVRPVENRVSTLEALRGEDRRSIDEMRSDIKELLRRTPPQK